MTAQITMQCRQGRDQTGPFPGFGILEHTRFFLGVNLIFFDNPKIFTKHLNTTSLQLPCAKEEGWWWYSYEKPSRSFVNGRDDINKYNGMLDAATLKIFMIKRRTSQKMKVKSVKIVPLILPCWIVSEKSEVSTKIKYHCRFYSWIFFPWYYDDV